MPAPALPALPCYLDGEFTTLPEAKISVMDRGFIFGDGVYEVLPCYGGRPFRFAQHMARLERSLAEVRIPNPLSHAQWRDVLARLLAAFDGHDGAALGESSQSIYLQITRGVALREHAMPAGIRPTVFVLCGPMRPPDADAVRAGVACVSADDFRWEKAHIKSTSLLGAVLARQIGVDAGAAETIMFRRGWLSEAAASNVWIVQDGRVGGPPRDNLVLEGVRYGLIEELCQAQGIAFTLRRIARDEVFQADEVLLSSATKELLAVTRLDGRPVGSGRPGPVFQRLHAAYQAAKAAARQECPA